MTKDLRRYARQTNIRLLVGFFLILLIVGDGLIYYIYGQGAAVMGLICIGLALVPAFLVWLVLAALDWIVKRADRD